MAPLPVTETLSKRYYYYTYDYTPRYIGIGVGIGIFILLVILALYLNSKKKQKHAERERVAELERQVAELHRLPLGGEQPRQHGGMANGSHMHGGVEKMGANTGVTEVSQPSAVYSPPTNGVYAPEIQGLPRNTAAGSELPSYR